MIVTDLSRMYRRVPAGSRMQRIIDCYRAPGFQSVLVYRFGHWLGLQRRGFLRALLKPVYVYLLYRCRRRWGIEINTNAVIGQGLLILHFGGVFIGPSIIGKNATISHDVTIGRAGIGPHRGVPTIGDNVYFAPGAKVSGRIRVGNNVKIGANAVVQRNIPDNALVQVPSMQVVVFPSVISSQPAAGIADSDAG